MYMLRRLCLLTGVLLLACMPAYGKTLKEMMDWLHETRKVNFVYDASLDVSMEYRGPSLERLSTKKALRQLFAGTGIEYQIKDSYVILKGGKRKNVSLTSKYVVREQRQSHTLSGFVRSGNGEPLLNATVYDLTGGIGTTTNEYGFFALTLPEGDHQLRYSYIGHAEKVERLSLQKDRHVDIELGVDTKLPEVVVTGDLNSPLLTTQTGKRSLLQQDIKTEYVLLSTPDLVKTLQRGSGVAEGMELMSGMYVHGGNGDENLFLLDGTPLYDINHAAGLFSSFNPDVVKNVDFYKSGFPARYGGRLSSVVDVRTKDGDMEHLHGSYRIGMIDAGVHLEGPIVKGKTSYNIGLRRSYSDFVMALIPWSDNEDEDVSLGYYFMDLNAKVSHRFNPRSKLSLSLYYGNDSYHTKSSLAAPYSSCWNPDDGTVTEYGWREDYSRYKLNWGNLNAALDWNCQLSPRLLANFTAVYTRNRARLYGFSEQKNRAEKENAEGETVVSTEHSYDNTIDDMGYRTAFDLRPTPRHKIRFGNDYTCHIFRPQTMKIHDCLRGFGETTDTVQMNSHNRQTGHELSVYAEDEMQLSGRWSVNAGLHASLFAIGGKTFVNADPRLAVKYQLSNTVSLKASLTRMTQYMHKLQNTYLSLPTDYWVPTTSRLKPMYAWQAAAGVYCQPSRHWTLSLEGYYKQSRHILLYDGGIGFEPPADRWDQLVTDGKGLFYGMELDATYRTERLTLTGSYTLSWNKRRYEDFFPDWFYDKYDNRHKLNLALSYKFGRKSGMYAAWSYHSGYHTTVPNQVVVQPYLPDNEGKFSGWLHDTSLAYTRPNNLALPDYHRLDVGFNFHHTTKKHHHERIWNISVFNVYCRRNPQYVTVGPAYTPDNGNIYQATSTSIIPFLLPSCSYTIKF